MSSIHLDFKTKLELPKSQMFFVRSGIFVCISQEREREKEGEENYFGKGKNEK